LPATQTVSFEGDKDRLQGYIARPEGEGPFPGVVIIHEAFGLNENMQDIARRFADEGYVAFAVDLFAGRNRAACMARFIGGMLRGTPERFGIGDLKKALSVLAEQPSVDGERVGAIGFCMGGGFAVAWACTDDRLKAIAPFYGVNPRPLSAVARSCPVVGSYPEKDFTARSGRKLDAELERHGIPRDIKIYEGARHSFFNDRGRSYDPGASEDAWRRTLAFFDEHVAGIEQKRP
jgi:carboxymethylenebutenolidase